MSMDSFVFKTLNQASLSKDEAKIITLGPLATAVYPIMTSAAFLRKDSAPFFKNDYKKADLFRAGALTEEQIMQYSNLICKKDENDAIMRINLFGYISTTKDRKFAENASFLQENSALKRVIYHIQWDYRYNHYYMDMGYFAHEK